MGLADLTGMAFGNATPTVQDATYDRAMQPEQYAAQQNTAQQGIAAGMGNLGAAAAGYQGVLNGTAPSVAENQLKQGQEHNAQQAQGMAAGARGTGNQLLAQQNAQQQNAMGGQAVNEQAATLRAGEQAQARQGLASVGANQQNMGQQYGLQSNAQNAQEGQFGTSTRVGVQQGNQAAQIATNKQNGGILGGVVGGLGGLAGL